MPPFVPHVLELPRRLEALRDRDEPVALVERARASVACERVEPQAAPGMVLRPIEHLRADAATLASQSHVELCDGLARGCDETRHLAGYARDAHRVARQHLFHEVTLLIFDRVRI